MKAVTFAGVRSVAVTDVPEPTVIEPTDAVVELDLAGLCGSDLHPYEGREPGLDPGTVMGHEITGRIVDVGPAVRAFSVGDLVMSPFSTSCGTCAPCARGMTARCIQGALFGWVERGRGVQGAQAERVRVPLADGTLVRRPAEISPLEALLLGDVVATGFFAVERASVARATPVAVVGLGAVGLSAILAARRAGADPVIALDDIAERRAIAESFGAHALPIRDDRGEPMSTEALASAARPLLGVEKAAVVVEAVGSPASTRVAAALLRPGGHISIASVHNEPAFDLSPMAAYDLNATISIGRCPARARLEDLARMQVAERLPLERLVTDRVPLSSAADAYRRFAERSGGCIKVVFDPRS